MTRPEWANAPGAVVIRSAARSVSVNRKGLEAFASRWPCADFPDTPVTFFFQENGDLCDMRPDTWEAGDGGAAEALVDDCRAMLFTV